MSDDSAPPSLPTHEKPSVSKLPTSMLFIDGTNLDRVCLDKFGKNDINFEKFIPAVTKGTHCLHTYYVTAPYKMGIDQKRYAVQSGMLNYLRRIPNVTVDLQQHRMREQFCRMCRETTMVPKEKGTDVSVASFLVEAAVAKRADRLILVANDSDYAPAMRIARKYGCGRSLAYVKGSDEKEVTVKNQLANLWNECNYIVRIDLEMMAGCWITGSV